MPGYSSYGAGVGNFGLNSFQAPDTTQREVMGTIIQASDPFWGGAEFIYAKASASIRQFGLVSLLATFDSTIGGFKLEATEAANVANTGRSVAVAMYAMTVGQFGWFAVQGNVPINGTATVAAGTTVGIVAAGQIGANSAGKQVLNAVSSAAATTTFAKANCVAPSGSTVLQVPNSDGWFPGAYLSGTGIQATTTVTAIDPTGRFVTLSLATSAAVTGTITATYNNAAIFYNVVSLNRPCLQGAIT